MHCYDMSENNMSLRKATTGELILDGIHRRTHFQIPQVSTMDKKL